MWVLMVVVGSDFEHPERIYGRELYLCLVRGKYKYFIYAH